MKNNVRNIPEKDPANFYVWTAFGFIGLVAIAYVLIKEPPFRHPKNNPNKEIEATHSYFNDLITNRSLSLNYFQIRDSVEEFREYINSPQILPLEDKINAINFDGLCINK